MQSERQGAIAPRGQRGSSWWCRAALGVAVGALMLAGGSTGVAGSTPVPPPAAIDPANFVATIDHRYLPLTPGTTYTYEGTQDGESTTIQVEVTHETKTILGVVCIVVRDRVWIEDELVEDTLDWYAQDRAGNVWYFGEAVQNFDGANAPNNNGSWEAGVDGAMAGILMPAASTAGEPYRQEYYPGEAEDMGQIVKTGEQKTVAYGAFTDVLVTREWSPLEPGVLEEKLYAPGIGLIWAQSIEGEDEQMELTGVQTVDGTPVA